MRAGAQHITEGARVLGGRQQLARVEQGKLREEGKRGEGLLPVLAWRSHQPPPPLPPPATAPTATAHGDRGFSWGKQRSLLHLSPSWKSKMKHGDKRL